MITKIVKVSDFTTIPGPRMKSSGDNSAEEFYEKFILPELSKKNIKIVIDFGGTWGYSISFISQLGIFIANKLGKDTFSRVDGRADDNPEVVERFRDLMKRYIDEAK